MEQGSSGSALILSFIPLIPPFLPHAAATPHTFPSTSGWSQGHFSWPPPMCHIPILHVALGSDVLLPFLQGCLPVSTCTQLSTPSPMDQRAVAAPASTHCCTANCSTAVWTHCRAWPDGIYPIQFSQWGAGMAACTPGHAGAPQSVLVLVLGEWL